ncbi:DUF393 domain-containing protein [Streptomyces carminius]|uniref:DUF393 domain-containing protein n=1 Tax=Streptomyces carminius TaxID=2665496 RepID=A0A2M8M0N7_9ACTN|nr:DCC1-like thiol-disulfide oxidoreductase family protein [Streptomyces carminius]PJE97056.1 DUF393 domain-containing protein [Streptomyces carminius]PJE97765.1 DUF393 domain-containing protein [Streptomyces carminius]
MGTRELPSTVLAFDGDCGFCQKSVALLVARAAPTVPAAPWQSLPERITRPHLARLEREVLLLDGGRAAAGGAGAVAAYLRSSPKRRYRAAGRFLALPGIRGCARLGYRWVAANRYRMPGSTPACAVPPRP